MLQLKSLTKSFKIVKFILFFILLSGCYSLRNVPTNQITKIPERKSVYYFHSDESVWIVNPIHFANDQFTGIIINPDSINNNKLHQVHFYIGPFSAIKIEDKILSVPMANIGKVEYYRINPGTVISSIGIVLPILLMVILF